MASLFRKLGELAGPKLRKAAWVWQSFTGNEDDILAAEVAAGRDLAAAMRQGLGVDPDAHVRGEVKKITDRLTRHVADRRRTFEVVVVAGGEPNAFALPGGFIFITRSLIELIGGNVHQVACILGHEMAHVIRQDPMNRIMADSAIGAAVKAARFTGPAGPWLASKGVHLMQAAYSQDQELLADRIGARLAHAAGFNPRAAIAMLEALARLHGEHPDIPLAEYFATHPPLPTRIGELRKYVASLH